MMMSHGMTLLQLTPVEDETWPDAIATLLAVHPIREGEGEDDFIAVVFDARLCHHNLCIGSHDRGVQFPFGFAGECEDVLESFLMVVAARDKVNAACADRKTATAARRGRAKQSELARATN